MNGMGWTEPTPVQIESIPVGLKGGDMFAQAQTGTGKTGAYGSIILSRIKPEMKFASALVLVPTRELANQVSEELSKLAKFTGHTCIPIYGGVGIGPQVAKLRRGTDIVVATPGRTKDLLNRNDLDLSKISVVVLDEADRMLDMGFAKDINFILVQGAEEEAVAALLRHHVAGDQTAGDASDGRPPGDTGLQGRTGPGPDQAILHDNEQGDEARRALHDPRREGPQGHRVLSHQAQGRPADQETSGRQLPASAPYTATSRRTRGRGSSRASRTVPSGSWWPRTWRPGDWTSTPLTMSSTSTRPRTRTPTSTASEGPEGREWKASQYRSSCQRSVR